MCRTGPRSSPGRLSAALESNVKQYLKTAITIALTAIVTFVVTAYFVAKSTKGTFVAATNDVEAFNDLHRIRSWDSLEQLLAKGCIEEALEYV